MNRELKPIVDYYPKMVQIPVGNKCNLKCVFCVTRQPDYYAGQIREKEEIPSFILDKFNDVFKEADAVYLTGEGEPLTSNIFWEFIEGKRESKGVMFNTNGTLLTMDNINRLLSYKGNLYFGISFNACRPETYLRITGVDGFGNIKANVKNLMDAAKKIGKDMKVFISLAAIKDSLDEMCEICDIAKDVGVFQVVVQIAEFFYDYTKGWFSVKEQSIRANPLLLEKFNLKMKKLEKKCNELGLSCYSKDGTDEFWQGICDRIFDYIDVKLDGETYSCCYTGVPTGKITAYDNFWDLWNNEKRQYMRSQLIRGEFPLECQKSTCPYWRVAQKKNAGN